MVTGSSPEHAAPGAFVRLRYRVAKLIYDSISGILVRAGNWQEELFGSLAPKAGDRILDFGRGNSSTSISLALRYPEAKVVGMESSCEAARRVQSKVIRNQIRNLSVVVAPLHGPLPFHAGTFDKVVCRLTLHDFAPKEKLAIVKEIARVIRRGGTFHVADVDKAESPGEGSILELARRISGPAAVAAHMDGNWTEFLAKGGFANVRRQSSHSIGFGRISVVKARKR
jgi:ubiquinone/menaquinone biosynthesis C-methylase UbiE